MKKTYVFLLSLLICETVFSQTDWIWFHNDFGYNFPSDTILAVTSYDYSDEPTIAGTANGLVAFDDASFTIYDTSNSILLDNKINCLSYYTSFFPVESQWIGTGKGICKWNFSSEWQCYTTQNSPLPNDSITAITLGNSLGGIWIGTVNGLVHFDEDSTWTIYDTDNSGLPSNKVQCLLFVGNGLYVGTDKGLAFFNDSVWYVKNTFNSGLPSDDITAVSMWSGKLWIGTRSSGACDSSFTTNEWKYFNTTNGLSSDSITIIKSDFFNPGTWAMELLIGTMGGGMCFINYSETITRIVNEVENTSFRNVYDASTNIPYGGWGQEKWTATEKGILFSASYAGISQVNSESLQVSAFFDGNILNVDYFSDKSEPIMFKISDAIGRSLLTGNILSQIGSRQLQIQLSQLPTQVYFLTIETPTNKGTVKVVKPY